VIITAPGKKIFWAEKNKRRTAMLKIEEIQKIREMDQRKLGEVNSITDGIVGARVGKIRKKAESLKAKIQELIDKKAETFTLPRSREETLELALDALKENWKKFFFEELLVPHLKDCQTGMTSFLNPDNVRVHLFTERNIWRLAYQIITEEDVKKAVEMLPDTGISSTDRDAAIKKLDLEILALEREIKKELENL
jgi:DNA repair exonuclease SbcCD ATPase subunit